MKSNRAIACLVAASLMGGCSIAVDVNDPVMYRPEESRDEINVLLDEWHQAASEGDIDTYFGAMGRDSVFLGSDDWERWPYAEFRAFAEPYFEDGHGWTFVPSEREIAFSHNGRTAWFDETLDSEHMGRCRGTGVLEWRDERWKILHYNLTFTIPNDLVESIKEQIDEYKAAVPDGDGETPDVDD